MRKRYCLLMFLLVIANGCTESPKEIDVELISMKKNSVDYDIVFLSKTDLTKIEESETVGYVFCLNEKEAQKKDFDFENLSHDYDQDNALNGLISEEIAKKYKNTDKFIYEVKVDYLNYQKPQNDKVLYCKVAVGKFFLRQRSSKSFKVSF